MLKIMVNGQKFFINMTAALLTFTFDSDGNGSFDKVFVTGANQSFLVADWNAAQLYNASSGALIGANPFQV